MFIFASSWLFIHIFSLVSVCRPPKQLLFTTNFIVSCYWLSTLIFCCLSSCLSVLYTALPHKFICYSTRFIIFFTLHYAKLTYLFFLRFILVGRSIASLLNPVIFFSSTFSLLSAVPFSCINNKHYEDILSSVSFFFHGTISSFLHSLYSFSF